MPARLHRPRDLADIGRPILRPGQEVKHRPVVPDIEASRLERIAGDIPAMPLDPGRRRAQSLSGNLQGGRGKVQYVHLPIAHGHQVIDQRRFAAADIYDPAFAAGRRLTDQLQRDLQVRPVPAHLVGAPGAVDVIPMGL